MTHQATPITPSLATPLSHRRASGLVLTGNPEVMCELPAKSFRQLQPVVSQNAVSREVRINSYLR
jgi:hypothetical protein